MDWLLWTRLLGFLLVTIGLIGGAIGAMLYFPITRRIFLGFAISAIGTALFVSAGGQMTLAFLIFGVLGIGLSGAFLYFARRPETSQRPIQAQGARAEIYISRPLAVVIWLILSLFFLIGVWIGSERLVDWVDGQLPLTLALLQREVILGSIRWGMRGLAIVILAIWLFRGCLKRVGSAAQPAQGVIAFLGQAVDVVGPGGLVFILGPFPEELWLLPTGQYTFQFGWKSGIYSKEDRISEDGRKRLLSRQPLDVRVAVYLMWPRPDREYTWIVERGQARNYPRLPRKIEKELQNKKFTVAGYEWRMVPGRELLRDLYYRLPRSINIWDAGGPRGIGPFLSDSIAGALRYALTNRDHNKFQREKPEIEEEMKYYLILEPGNPFREWGIPPECVDIELTAAGFREAEIEAEKAWIAPEIAERRFEASAPESRRIERLMRGYKREGASPDMAAILASGVARGEERVDLSAMRDLAIVRFLAGGFLPFRPRARRRRS